MIENPPAIVLRREFPRPSRSQLDAFAAVPTGHVVDALGGRGALDYRIKPIDDSRARFHGVALTSDNGPADNLAAFCSLAACRPGDVLIAACDDFTGTAVSGDLMLGMAKNLGAAAFVTDGCVRDIVGIRETGLPCYCRGVTANSPGRNGPGSVGLPVVLGGVGVQSGDIILGDLDGVVVVPHDRIDAVIAALDDVRRAEAALDSSVRNGLTIPPFVEDILAGDRVRQID